MTTKLPPTGRFLFLNKAAVIMDGELDEDGNPRNTWRLCSVQQVEQLKCLIGIIPVWVSGLGCFLVMDQQASFGTLQAIQMNRSVLFGSARFKVPPAWMGITSMIALSIWILVYERVYVVTFKKISGRTGDDDHACRLTPSQRIRVGIFMSILCMLSAAVVEQKRRASALKHRAFESPLSFALLLPQFVLSGLTEALAAVAIMEFFTTEIPENMRSLAGSVFFLSLSFASYLSSILVNVIHSATKRKGRSPWLGGHDLNKNRLEYYYYIIAAIAGLNFLYYNLVASSYVTSSSKEDVTESRAMENSRSRLMTELEQRGDINGSEEIGLQRIAAAV
ncbi:unnamed protein product [Cuscuta epithymum]|nr:unnamed protein product [Cuscuta epithymum]